MKKTILLTNDDGIGAPGIRALKKELGKMARVVLVAPETQRSWIGKAITRHSPVALKKVSRDEYSTTGTPADCVQIALHSVCKKPSLVVSGINLGENWGIAQLFSSGTQGAAIEAALLGVPAVAFSHYFKEFLRKKSRSEEGYSEAAKRAAGICETLLRNYPKGVSYLNVNFPDPVFGETPIEITRISEFNYEGIFKLGKDGKFLHKGTGGGSPKASRGTDAAAILSGKISITPLKLRLESPRVRERFFG